MIPYISFESKRQPFAAKNPLVEKHESLIVFIDRASFEDNSELEFLLKQADGEKLVVVSTGREGTSQLVYKPIEHDILGFSVTRFDGKGESHHAIPFIHQYREIAAQVTQWGTIEEIERAFITAKTFEEMDGHIFITNDKFLLEHKDLNIIADSFPMSIAEATALIGLIFRRRNHFDIVTYRRGNGTMRIGLDRGSFFWYASRDLLPAAWRLVTACSQMSDKNCRDLALKVISRTANALKCRDHIQEQIFLEQSNNSTEDAIYYLDYYLISFTAAFDVLARISNELYKPLDKRGKKFRTVSWRGKDWLRALSTQDPALGVLMSPTAFNRDILDFIASLRNYIHAEGLQGSMHQKNGKPAPLLVRVPEDEALRIAGIIQRITRGSWVVENSSPTMMWLEIGDLVEKITPMAIRALDSIMGAIDIARIPNLDQSKVQTSAPAKWATPQELADIRRLLGL